MTLLAPASGPSPASGPGPRSGPGWDAVVVGAGPNGLVAANLLADSGWDVVVLEANSSPGGAVASTALSGHGGTAGAWMTDVCSAFYPLAVSSPVFERLDLESYGVRWLHTPLALAHPLGGSDAAVISRDLDHTADVLDKLSPGDGRAWCGLHDRWADQGADVLRAMLDPFPPVKAAAKLARKVGLAGGLRLARMASLPVRRLAEEEFSGTGPGLLLAGCAVHADLVPEAALSSFFGWLLAMLAQDVGFPAVAGGASQLTAALVRRLESRGGRVLCDRRVREIEVLSDRASAAITSTGERFAARQAVLADVAAPSLFGGLVGWEHLPTRMRDDMARFQWDWATVKFDWGLRAKVPWEAKEAGTAGCVHLAESLDSLSQYGTDVAMGRIPASPFVLLGQLTTCDPSRSPSGTEVLYGYTHVPRNVKGDAGDGSISGAWDDADCEAMAARVEDRIERFAPGFKSLIEHRRVTSPIGLQAHDQNLVDGAINGGTAELHQQLVFRPVPGLGRPETPVAGLYLASASAHPGGGVHGACGANAARAALNAAKPLRRYTVVPALAALQRAAYRPDMARSHTRDP